MKTLSSNSPKKKISPAAITFAAISAALAIALCVVSIFLVSANKQGDAATAKIDAGVQKNMRFFANFLPTVDQTLTDDDLSRCERLCYAHALTMTELFPMSSYAAEEYDACEEVIENCFRLTQNEEFSAGLPQELRTDLTELASLLFNKDLAEVKAKLILETYFTK